MTTLQDRLFALLTDKMGIPAEDLSVDATLDALELDSLALIELSVSVQKEFGAAIDETALVPENTLGDILRLLESQIAVA
jgi:acyl carrier protein